MKIHNIFNELNGFFSLTKLKPSYIHFAKTDISDIKRGSKKEAATIWGNVTVKAIGSISSNAENNCEGIFFKKFRQNPIKM